jgi:surface protein
VTSPTTAATTYGNIAEWDVSSVSNMYRLFYNKPTFNSNIGGWNVASVSSMQQMFAGASAFNQVVGAWNTASVTNMQAMFFGGTPLNGAYWRLGSNGGGKLSAAKLTEFSPEWLG